LAATGSVISHGELADQDDDVWFRHKGEFLPALWAYPVFFYPAVPRDAKRPGRWSNFALLLSE